SGKPRLRACCRIFWLYRSPPDGNPSAGDCTRPTRGIFMNGMIPSGPAARTGAMTTLERSLQPDLARWNVGHSVAMIVVATAVAAGLPPGLPGAVAALSLAVLIRACRGRWTPAGRFGPANAITMARLYGMFALPFLPPRLVAIIG